MIRDLAKQRVITFRSVRSEIEGVRAEHSWIAKNLPGYRWKQQRLIHDTHRRICDAVTLADAHGHETTVYFDITNWFGHW